MEELSHWLKSRTNLCFSNLYYIIIFSNLRHGINTPVNQAMVFFVKALEAKFLGEKQNWEVFM